MPPHGKAAPPRRSCACSRNKSTAAPPRKSSPHLRRTPCARRPGVRGKATRRQIRIYFSENKAGPKMDLLIYVPAAASRSPFRLSSAQLFRNQTVAERPGIHLGEVWTRDPVSKEYRPADKPPKKSRGSNPPSGRSEKILTAVTPSRRFTTAISSPISTAASHIGDPSALLSPRPDAAGPDEWGASGPGPGA